MYAGTTLRSNYHHSYLNSADRRSRDTDNNKMEQRSQELDRDMHMSCMHFHSLLSARVIPVRPIFDPQNQLGVVGPKGIRKDKARCVKSADTVCVQEYLGHLNVDGLRVLPADFLSPRLKSFLHPWSLRWRPIRFEQVATVLITYCVHTPGDSTRAPSRWCASNHPQVALDASTRSYLLRPRCWHHDDHSYKRRSKSDEGGHFFGTMRKNSVRDDYARPFSQLVLWKCLSCVFLHSNLIKGLFEMGESSLILKSPLPSSGSLKCFQTDCNCIF